MGEEYIISNFQRNIILAPETESKKGITMKEGKTSKYDIVNKIYSWIGKNIYLGGKNLDKQSTIDYLAKKMDELENDPHKRVYIPESIKLKKGKLTDSDEKVMEAYRFILHQIPEKKPTKPFFEEDVKLPKDSDIEWFDKSMSLPEKKNVVPEKSKGESESQNVSLEELSSHKMEEEEPLFGEEVMMRNSEKINEFIHRFDMLSSNHEVIKLNDNYAVRLIFDDDDERESFINKNGHILDMDKYETGNNHDLTLTTQQTYKLVPHYTDLPNRARQEYQFIMSEIYRMQNQNRRY